MSIGRYSPEKKFEVLIDAYAQLKAEGTKHELHLIGAYKDEDKQYYKDLVTRAKGLGVTFHKNMPHNKVLDFLQTAHIYWHARGYGETDPVEYENFGITTAEAASAGCTPIVINLGAQPEMIGNKKLVWNTPEELVSKTKAVIQKKEAFKANFSKYSSENFLKHMKKLLF